MRGVESAPLSIGGAPRSSDEARCSDDDTPRQLEQDLQADHHGGNEKNEPRAKVDDGYHHEVQIDQKYGDYGLFQQEHDRIRPNKGNEQRNKIVWRGQISGAH